MSMSVAYTENTGSIENPKSVFSSVFICILHERTLEVHYVFNTKV